MVQHYQIDYVGDENRITERYKEFERDLNIYDTRPWLNGKERHDFLVYFNYTASNKIIGLLNFDAEGNYLPDVYSAPEEIFKMLYPIDDLIQYDKRGTLIIDPEQYTPELKRLSYFIYMVDEKLFYEYAKKNNYLGEIKSTFMFNRDENDGVRIFKDYYELARHLARKRQITYCLGPRAIFYLRYYLYELHVHTVENQYAFGKRVSHSYAQRVLESIKWHLAFRNHVDLEYDFELTVDKYRKYRQLAERFKMFLPNQQEFKSKTMIQRFSKQTMHSKLVVKIKRNKEQFYQTKCGIQPWHHLLIVNDHLVAYVWDSREIQAVIPITEVDKNDITYHVIDNRNDLKITEKAPENVRTWVEANREDIPVQFRYNEPDSTFDGSEESHWR